MIGISEATALPSCRSDPRQANHLGALGGTLNGDPCSLLGVIGVLPGYIRGIQGLYKG